MAPMVHVADAMTLDKRLVAEAFHFHGYKVCSPARAGRPFFGAKTRVTFVHPPHPSVAIACRAAATIGATVSARI